MPAYICTRTPAEVKLMLLGRGEREETCPYDGFPPETHLDVCPECGNASYPGIVITGGDICSGPLGDVCDNVFHDPMRRCDRPPTGWYCKLEYNHEGSCPTYRRWWNLRAWFRLRRAF